MSGRLMRSALGGLLEQEITETEARAEIEAAEALGRGFVEDLGDGVTAVWTRGEGGCRIAPVYIWRPDAGIPEWHRMFFAQFASRA